MHKGHRILLPTWIAIIGSLLSYSAMAQPLLVLASSHFDDTNNPFDGWRGTNSPTYQTNMLGGATSNSVGYLRLVETKGDGQTMYFVAPAKFLGDKRAAYNGVLRLAHRQDATSQQTGGGNFVLLGSSNTLLSFSLRGTPSTTWTSFEIPLNENVGWINTTSNTFATQEDFQRVMLSVNRLWIRAEYSTQNTDQSDLDDVELLGRPSGPLQPSLTASTFAGVTIHGAIGTSYRIESRSALDAAATWQKLSDLVLPTSPYLFIDQTSPGTTNRFYRAVLNP